MSNKTDDTPMTQEELMIALDKVYCAETGMPSVFGDMSDLIDTHVENDYQHFCFISVFEWMHQLIQERDDGYTQDAIE